MRLACLLVVTALACAPAPVVKDRRGDVDGRAFEFATSGAEFTEEHGQWMVRVRGDALWIAHTRDGKTHDYGTSHLTEKERKRLWKLVAAARIDKRKAVRRAGMTREATYMFALLRPGRPNHTIEVRMAAAARDEALDALVSYLARLIRLHAKTKPGLRPSAP